MGFQKLFKKKKNNRRSKNGANDTGHDNDSVNSTVSPYDRYDTNEEVEIIYDRYDNVESIGKVTTKEDCNSCGDGTNNNEANNDIMFGSMMIVDDDDDENNGWDTTIPVNEDKYKTTSNEQENNENDDDTISYDEQYQPFSCLEFLGCV